MDRSQLVSYLGQNVNDLLSLTGFYAENHIDRDDLHEVDLALQETMRRLQEAGYVRPSLDIEADFPRSPQHEPKRVVNRRYGEVENFNVDVPNQFNFHRETRQACVAISIVAVYHIYAIVIVSKEKLQTEHWRQILEQGKHLWESWKLWRDNARWLCATGRKTFPTLSDILTLRQSDPFVKVFGREPLEYGGLVMGSGPDNPEGSLCQLMETLTTKSRETRKNICALLILPNYICLSLVVVRRTTSSSRTVLDMEPSHILLFDSHGGVGERRQFCEFIRFSDHRDVLQHLLQKYQLETLQLQNMSAQERAAYTEEELASLFSYSAMLFIK